MWSRPSILPDDAPCSRTTASRRPRCVPDCAHDGALRDIRPLVGGPRVELMLADTATGDLDRPWPRSPRARSRSAPALERYTVTGELLTNTVEVTSGVGDTVAAAVDDIADAIAEVRTYTDPHGVDLLCAGSHPFAQWYDQQRHRQDPLSQAHRAHAVVGSQHDDLGHPRARRRRRRQQGVPDHQRPRGVPASPAGAVGVEPVLGR